MMQKETVINKRLAMFDKAAMSMIQAFCKKHGVYLDYSVNDDLSGILCLGDNFFNLSDIYFDLKQNKPKGKIFEWQDYLTDYNIRFNGSLKDQYISFDSYCMGYRFDDLKI